MLNQVRIAFIAVVALALGVALLQKAGEYLVMDRPIHTDVVVVLRETEMIAACFAVLN